MTYKELQGLPHDHEVKTFDVGSHQLSLVEITPENKDALTRLAVSMYAGEPCRICGELITMDDMYNGAVYAGYSADNAARTAHKDCWQRSPGIDDKPNKDWVHQ